MRRTRALIAFALTLLVGGAGPGVSWAAPAGAASSVLAHAQNLLLDLCVNGTCHGTAFILKDAAGVYWIDQDAMRRADVRVPVQDLQQVDAETFVPLSAFPGATAHEDAAQGRLVVVLPANGFSGQRIDITQRPALMPAAAVPSAFVNYALSDGTTPKSASVYLDGAYAAGRGLFRDNPSWNEGSGFSRGLTRYEYDDTDHLRRWTFGDQYATATDGLGGTALLGGVGVARAFDLDPYLVTFPQPTLGGLLQAPGTVKIYENGILVATHPVAAGPFSLGNLGVGPGVNNVQVVIQDPFGGTRVLQQTFYGANQLLAQGLSDWAVQSGLERASVLDNGYMGGRGVLVAHDNYGWTNWLTVGARIEAQSGLTNTGANALVRVPVGVLSTAAAVSDWNGAVGHAVSESYQFTTHRIGVGAGVQVFSSDYRKVGDDLLLPGERPRRTESVNLSYTPSGVVSLQVTAGALVEATGIRQRNAGVNGTVQLPHGASLSLYLSRQWNHPGTGSSSVLLNLVVPMGRGSIGASLTHSGAGGWGEGLSAQSSVPTDHGWGYNASVLNSGGQVQGSGQVDYLGRTGLAQLEVNRFGNQASAQALYSGSLVAIDGHVFAAQTIQNGYALVETPNIANVTVTRENQPVARTDSTGSALITNLLPYQANRIGLDTASIPMSDSVDGAAQTISVPRLAGSVVAFGVRALHAVRGRLQMNAVPLQYGTGALHDAHGPVATSKGPVTTLIGVDGAIYLPEVAPGAYSIVTVSPKAGRVACPFVVPAHAGAMTDVGVLSCRSAP